MAHSQNDWEIAVHEAGHAVIGVIEGLSIERASVAPGPNGIRLGRVFELTWPAIASKGYGTQAEIDHCSRLAREMMAGPHATLEFYPDAHHGGGVDFEHINQLAEELFAHESDRVSWTQKISDEVWILVARYKDAIQQVADDLLNKGDQKRADLDRTIAVHPPKP